jgi:hypothetical protein
MVSPDDLITGALPFVNYSGPTSSVISTGVAPTHTGGVATLPAAADGSGVSASAQLGGARAMATATGGTILVTWLAIVALLVAVNVFTFRVQG